MLLLLQVSNGYIQVRYNLGEGSKILRASSVVVTDAEPRTVLVSRTLGSLEIVVNNSHIARSPSTLTSGSNTTLSVLAEHLFLGAEVNVTTGGVIRGFRGCLQGIKLDRKEVPLTSSGSSSYRVVKFPSGGTISGCPLLNVMEREQPDVYVYAGLGAVFGGTLLISFVFVLTCALIGFCWRKKNGNYEPNTSRHGSPGHSGFSWTPANELGERKLRSDEELELQPTNYMSGHMRSSSYQSQTGDTTSPFSHSNSTFQKPLNLLSVGIEPKHARQDSRQSGKSLGIPYPPEGFSAVSQENPSYRNSSPAGSDEEDGARRALHVRSSSDHFSVRSDGSSKNMHSGGELETSLGVRKRVEMANADLGEIGFDEIKHYDDEGPYEPMGSIGSLYDILSDTHTAPVNASTPGLTYEPSAASPTRKIDVVAPDAHIIAMKSQPPDMVSAPRQPQVPQQPADYSTPMKTQGEPTTPRGPPLQQIDNRLKKQKIPSQRTDKRRPSQGKSARRPAKTNPLTMPPPPPPPPPPPDQLTPEKISEKSNPLLYDAQHSKYHMELGKVSHHQHQTQVQFQPNNKTSTTSGNTGKQQGKKWEVSIYQQECDEEVAPAQMGHNRQSQRMRRSARRSNRHVRNRSVENILDKFHNFTIAGGLSQDSKEVTKVL